VWQKESRHTSTNAQCDKKESRHTSTNAQCDKWFNSLSGL